MLARIALPAAAVTAFVLFAAACSSGDGSTTAPDGDLPRVTEAETDAAGDLTREAEAGGITVEATWLTAEARDAVEADLTAYPQDDFVVLELSLDTHSGDLNSIDLAAEASLNQGEATVAPEAWVSTSDDAHHRSGLLVFPRKAGDGPVSLSLVIEEEEVALTWETAPST